MQYITVALAGHVNHGKTSFIKALTGIDTDTLEQEKKRGLTIELGFAYLEIKNLNKVINFIDVPGHQSFIKNMLAGISGVNTVFLVISANEGIMQQTIEHIDIIQLLNIKNIIIVITKTDTVDNNRIVILKNEIQSYFNNKNLKILDIINFSVKDSSNETILKYLENLNISENLSKENNFVLPIDRVFIKNGVGSIITGTVYSGTTEINNYLYFKNEKVKIKNIHFNGNTINKALTNQRISLNISHNHLIKKGDILSSYKVKDHNVFYVSLNTITNIKNNSRIKFYYLSKEVNGRIVLFNKKSENNNIKTFAKIVLNESVPIKHDMKYLIRLESPEITIGGGRVLVFENISKKINNIKKIKILEYINKNDYTNAFEYLLSEVCNTFSYNDICYYFDAEIANDLINKYISSKKIIELDNGIYTTYDNFLKNKEIVKNFLREYKNNNADMLGLTKSDLSNFLNLKIELLDKILLELLKSEISIYKGYYFLNHENNQEFTPNEKKLINLLNNNIFQNHKDLSISLNLNTLEIKNIIDLLKFKSAVITIDPDIVIKKDKWNEIENLLKSFISIEKKSTSQIKNYLKLSRKYAIPVLEYCDKKNITQRDGDFRFLK